MNRYIIYCSEEQTRKALQLGAPIEIDSHSHGRPYIQNGTSFYLCPTSEQMIGWLEEQGIQVSIMFSYQVSPKKWNYDLDNNNLILFEHNSMSYTTRKEATLAAIDAALGYLEHIKV